MNIQFKQIKLIAATEYLTDIKAKSFWVATILLPIITIGFGVLVGFLATDSSAMQSFSESMSPNESDDLTGMQIVAMLLGMCLTMFLMVYGAQIFNKVKVEKSNRIVEILSTCVDGRTMMLAKILAVGMVGATQILLWGLLVGIGVAGIILVFAPSIPFDFLLDIRIWEGMLWGLLFFLGGYVFFGSMYAACGAMSDKDNENQEYMTLLTFLLLASFYLGQFAVDNPDNTFVQWMCYIPFTSPVVAAVNAVSGEMAWWMSGLQLVVLYFFAWVSLSFSGKIYRSSLLLRGKKFTPKDIIIFLRAK